MPPGSARLGLKHKIRVYIAGPFRGAEMDNTRIAIQMAEALIKLGFIPYVPHLTGFWHFLSPHRPDYWFDLDNAWLILCDAVLRLSGESEGASKEVKFALEHEIPVFHSVREIQEFFPWISGCGEA